MPSKACINKKRRKQLFTLEFDPKLSHKKLTKKAHKNQIIPKKAKNKIPRKRNEKKKLFDKKTKKYTLQTITRDKHPTHPSRYLKNYKKDSHRTTPIIHCQKITN